MAIEIEKKIDHDPSSKGKWYAREVNLVTDNANEPIKSSGDKRSTPADRKDQLLGAIDDIIKSELYYIDGTTVKRFKPYVTTDGQVIEIPEDHNIIKVLITDKYTPNSKIDIMGVQYTAYAGNGKTMDTVTITENSLLEGYIDRTNQVVQFTKIGDFSAFESGGGGLDTASVTGNTTITKESIVSCATAGTTLAVGSVNYTITLDMNDDGSRVVVRDKDLNASKRPIKVNTVAGYTINGLTDYTLDVNGFEVDFILDGTKWTISNI